MRIGYGTSVTVPSQQERWFSEMRAGRCFARGQGLAASVGNVSEVQLFNPVGSGKQILVYRALASPGAADTQNWRIHNTALATLFGTGVNLLVGGAAGVGEIRTAQPAAPDGSQVGFLQSPATAMQEIASVWMGELSPGQGMLVTTNGVNLTITVMWFWNEV